MKYEVETSIGMGQGGGLGDGRVLDAGPRDDRSDRTASGWNLRLVMQIEMTSGLGREKGKIRLV